MRRSFYAMLLVAVLCVPCFGDSLDEAEAKRRGVPVERVQLENAQAKIAALQRQVNELQDELAAAKADAKKSKSITTTAPATKPSTVTTTSDATKSPATDGSKTVTVSGYTRKDGTYVAPYTRSAPKSKK